MGAKTHEERLHWMMMCARGVRSGASHLVRFAFGALSDSSDFCHPCGDEVFVDGKALNEQIRLTNVKIIEAEITEVIKKEDKMETTGMIDKLVARGLRWRRHVPRVSSPDLLSHNDEVADSDEASATLIEKSWGEVFKGKPIDDEIAGSILLLYPLPSVPMWSDDHAGNADCISRKLGFAKDSSPGPDGVPHAAWKATARWSVPLLSRASQDFCDHSTFPKEATSSIFAFIPKQDSELREGQRILAVNKQRPLSLTSSDSKLVLIQLAMYLSNVAVITCAPYQRCIRGRNMMDNILELEGKAFEFLKRCEPSTSVWCFDVSSAFPSLAQAWMIRVLRHIGIPVFVVNMILAVYADNVGWLRWKSSSWRIIKITSGIRQGCVLSMSLWAISFDPLLRHIAATLPPCRCLLLAYADDIAIVINHTLNSIACILVAMKAMALAANLIINESKTQFMPLYEYDEKTLRGELQRLRLHKYKFKVL